ncbi:MULTISPECIES: protein-L-isoaspartate(D-aspartate) O-methyltransferase [unclassified Halanaerobium]|uniref:protein-L-isoaspartate(D-aspartate) O-methyltransferase n=1 Tax=unclassified Halanaerobium TaxID=2641197 RepID=UPI000E17D32F|nr:MULTISPECIES: protein-L-isoaspartate(D-aspartate) O-methyltransferase [unclassified Halanaerobium]RCW48721.1 protein-L-isoaspartate(D-aspartate) O-methyltransferase [Halanaerobium sp. MA284_MarDTE_T2]RCW89063.1 protein-L-isoaspartate(D-aspartate) O-methyltransferase [Halanaerobium sp. DL-01]
MTADYKKMREEMVKKQLVPRGINDKNVLDAMRTVPREKFVLGKYKNRAYADSALPIDFGQTISQPYIAAAMIQLIKPKKEDKILEIGTGSGYAAAVLAQIAAEVYTVERIAELAKKAEKRFKDLEYSNIMVKTADGTLGWEKYSPFDKILVSAAAPSVPEKLKKQLADGGLMVVPVGEKGGIQQLMLIERKSAEKFSCRELDYVRFVPLIGENGY